MQDRGRRRPGAKLLEALQKRQNTNPSAPFGPRFCREGHRFVSVIGKTYVSNWMRRLAAQGGMRGARLTVNRKTVDTSCHIF